MIRTALAKLQSGARLSAPASPRASCRRRAGSWHRGGLTVRVPCWVVLLYSALMDPDDSPPPAGLTPDARVTVLSLLFAVDEVRFAIAVEVPRNHEGRVLPRGERCRQRSKSLRSRTIACGGGTRSTPRCISADSREAKTASASAPVTAIALGKLAAETVTWVWIGTHSEYDRLAGS